jgi:uncharacterized protein (TIGR03435 family)
MFIDDALKTPTANWMRLIGTSTLPILLVGISFAQSPQFEVASIRPSAPTPDGQVSVGVHIDGSQVRVVSLSLRDYLAIAYRTKGNMISGPDWTGSERFDISATLPPGSNAAQLPEMFQALLADRFHVKLHKEQKEFPVYALLVGKGSLKLKESPSDPDKDEPKGIVDATGGGSAAGVSVNLGHGSSWSFVPNRFEAKKLTMEQFAANLERFAARPIVDMTGLKGQYDLAFDVNPEDYQPMLIRSAVYAGVVLPPQALRLLDDTSSAALGDALQQTGLKLEPRKAPLDVLVVDDALKTPTAN